MILAVDRDDPVIREAMDQAARVAEHLLESRNDDYAQELALDVLAAWLDGFDDLLYDDAAGDLSDPRRRLAWALTFCEQREDLAPHEQRLLDDSWEKVKELQLQRTWEEMGR